MPFFSYNKGNEKEGGFHSGSKGTEHTFQQSAETEKSYEQYAFWTVRWKDETNTELKETINDLKKTIAGLRGTRDK